MIEAVGPSMFFIVTPRYDRSRAHIKVRCEKKKMIFLAIFSVTQCASMGALDLSYLGVTIENMEGPTAPITGVCMHHNVPFFNIYSNNNVVTCIHERFC